MDVLVGGTGFVGSNLRMSHDFTYSFHSTNISNSYGLNPDILVYAGVPSSMVLANTDPGQDKDAVLSALENIKKIKAEKTVLISTVAVYDSKKYVNEDQVINGQNLPAYGKNRLWLENEVFAQIKNSHIIRLPALYGQNLKKNFIYDMMHPVPELLRYEKYCELVQDNKVIQKCYKRYNEKFYKKIADNSFDSQLLSYFESVGFTALNFTDSCSIYQFFNLKFLWNYIITAIKKDLRVLNICTEPVSAGELYQYITGKAFYNPIMEKPYQYDIRTKYKDIFGGDYIFTREYVLKDIKQFYNYQLRKNGV